MDSVTAASLDFMALITREACDAYVPANMTLGVV